MVRYAFYLVVFLVIIGGAYFAGYKLGSSNAKIEYVVKEKEVIKYVAKETAIIHSKPNAGRNELILLYKSGKL